MLILEKNNVFNGFNITWNAYNKASRMNFQKRNEAKIL
jgi:hypothetical protein